jgi:hypothetical protein
MTTNTTRIVAASAVALFAAVSILSAAIDPLSRTDAARLQAKIERINRNGDRHASLRTPVTEAELNAYLRYELGDKMPAGVKDPWVSILGDGRVEGRATVDLAQVGQARKGGGGMLDPYSLLTGSLPLTVNGVLRTRSGVGTFSLESASISGVPVPSWMLQEIVSHYSRSAGAPEGVSIEKPFALPAGIREIEVARGQAIVVQ